MASDLMTYATQERTDLLALLETLTPEQWTAPSLCAGWSVREVVAHMFSYDALGWAGAVKKFAQGRFIPERVNAIVLREYADRSPGELIQLVRGHLRPRGLTTGFGGMIALVDGTVHHQDIRRALDLPREIPADRLRATLRVLPRALVIRPGPRMRGLTMVATDVDWTHGSGPEVRGPGEALLMAIAGRGHALKDLSGPGLPVLSQRV